MNNAFPDLLPVDVTALYGQTPSNVIYVTQVQNRVYRYRDSQGERILRLTPETHRTSAEVTAEIEWVLHLSKNGAPVAAPVSAQDGHFWHRVKIEDAGYTVVAFDHAPGQIGSRQWWTPEVFHQWGQLTGKLHRITRDYRPPGESRQEWLAQLPSFSPESRDEEIAFDQLNRVIAQLHTLPRTPDGFGLIHADLHFWNFAVDAGKITVFDFDNSEYNWLIADIGTAVFEASTCFYRQGSRAEFIRLFLETFLTGYRRENDLDGWIEYLPLFIKLRENSIFLILSRRWRGKKLGEFQQTFFASLREGVLQNLRFLET